MGPGACRRTRLYFCFGANRELGTCSAALGAAVRSKGRVLRGHLRRHFSLPRSGLKPGFLDIEAEISVLNNSDAVKKLRQDCLCLPELIEKRFCNCFVVSSLFMAAFWPRIVKKMLLLSFSGSGWLCLISLYFTAFFGEPIPSHMAIISIQGSTGTPCFIAFCFMVLHRCCGFFSFLQIEGRILHQQKVKTSFILILALLHYLLYWGVVHLNLQYLRDMPISKKIFLEVYLTRFVSERM